MFLPGTKVYKIKHSSFGPGFSASVDYVHAVHKNGRVVLKSDHDRAKTHGGGPARTFKTREYQGRWVGECTDFHGPTVHLYDDYLPLVRREVRRRSLVARLKVAQDMCASLRVYSSAESMDATETILALLEPALGIERIVPQVEEETAS